MKTKELIKLLQEADPNGESYVRIDDGIPVYVERKPGYYDGSYSYYDEDRKYCISKMDSKVDIHTTAIFDYVVDNMGSFPNNKSIEEVLDKFNFYLSENEEQNNKEKERYVQQIINAYNENIKMDENLYEEALANMYANALNGWTWFQNKLVDTIGKEHHFYTWLIYNENEKKIGSCINNTESIVTSGLWEKVDNNKIEGYYEWKYIK
jgi:hypothetical protein